MHHSQSVNVCLKTDAMQAFNALAGGLYTGVTMLNRGIYCFRNSRLITRTGIITNLPIFHVGVCIMFIRAELWAFLTSLFN